MTKQICIVGGGISGLCTAYHLKKKGYGVLLIEKNKNCGGNIQTEKDGDFLIEWGPNSVLRSPHLIELLDEIGLINEIANANLTSKKRYVLRGSNLQALPTGVANFIRTDFLSNQTKLKILREPFVKSKSNEKESVADFFRRRFGQEIVDYALDPFVSGIYAGNPEKLSLKYAFPRLFELEKRFGSVIKGFIGARNENKIAPKFKKFSRTLSFKHGMRTLVEKLVELLRNEIKTNTEVSGISKSENGRFQIQTNDEQTSNRIFDAVVIAAPSYAAGRLVEDFDRELAENLKQIYHPPLVVVVSAFRREDVNFDLDGFGFLVPKVEKRRILGSLWSSVIFENRAPAEFYLMTTFIGGVRNAELFDES
ncbi:MAG: protoporphyrinogen oxidase, partial [Acidobacteria bacterium]|nr:protoporphyrinogen oxidase [Acidobacteriota bacterium]